MSAYTPPSVFCNTTPGINVRVRGDSGSKGTPTIPSLANITPRGTQQPTQGFDNVQNNQLPFMRQQISRRQFQNSEEGRDIASGIEGLYRVFDLINEQSSSGLVDKIVIAQDGLKRLINDLRPGAYLSLTRVDFKALDSLSIRPIGVYGDRIEISKLLVSIKVIDDHIFQLLRLSKDDLSHGPFLRSGIYIARPPKSDILYAIYWPQDETWNDNAPSGPRRNRVTFMRYLTKMSDQILCFMPNVQSQAFVWDHDEGDASDTDPALDCVDKEDEDRLYTFEIAQTNEQEEKVIFRPGFHVPSNLMRIPETPERPDDDILLRPPPPVLMLGETSQGFLSVESLPPGMEENVTSGEFSAMRLRDLLKSSSVRIECDLDDKAISALIRNGLENGPYQGCCKAWKERKNAIGNDMDKAQTTRLANMEKFLVAGQETLTKQVMAFLIGRILDEYPTLDPGRLSRNSGIDSNEVHELKSKFTAYLKAHKAEDVLSHASLLEFERKISEFPFGFRDQKQRIACVQVISKKYREHYNDDSVRSIIGGGQPENLGPKQTNLWTYIWSFINSGEESDLKKDVEEYCRRISDRDFLADLDTYMESEPLVEPATRRVSELVHTYLSNNLTRIFGSFISFVLKKQRDLTRSQLVEECKQDKEEAGRRSAAMFIQGINSVSADNVDMAPVVILERFEVITSYWARSDLYDVSARCQTHIKSTFQYRINRLEIPSDHQHKLQLDPSFIPAPVVNHRGSISLTLPPDRRVLHSQLLAADRVLLVIDQGEKIGVYLDHISSIGNALSNGLSKKLVDTNRIGTNTLVTFDETKRLFALCAPQKRTLHIFVFDEQFSTLQGWARPFELSGWYNNGETIAHICFVTGTGSEELLLVDSRAQARIYSLVSQRFRPASISLLQSPTYVMSSPDGACALLVFEADNQRILAAYHWDTFGASEGVTTTLPEKRGSLSVTSFVNQQSIHLMMLDEEKGYCQSLALTITKKSSEFTFKEKGAKASIDTTKGVNYINNCLIDCFADVWTRFPVMAAVSQHSITSSASRQLKSVTFVSNQVHDKYASYFSDMVRKFEDQTKKPTDGQLRAISIQVKTYPTLIHDLFQGLPTSMSQFLAGQWFVNLLCLLPIHIAVAHDNRFVPLKDGVLSAEFEKNLLGAELGRIVDSLSFGWYESILRSYMADKPVKVVSSMGEQSVGKSFALNHLMDTSFAGSAMRTTEGVWMSITPTDDALLVALDFEGVHSIERSPQEDALLVLFNTAISNLVLFRNNFALSRDIADLFQSFQASSVILDPAANPSLFQSTLDVVESDQREIVREFSLKLQNIVRAEQGSNFISRLHAGRLDIIPWPVIESSRFYTLYSILKRRLDSQKITYPSAGEFLYTLKILMSKLKANDWGAMSQSLAAHRAQTLLAILPTAFQYGLAEVGSSSEPLKNLDNDTVIDSSDTELRLFLSSHASEPFDREDVLAELRRSWEKYDTRHDISEVDWIDQLTVYLSDVVKLRVAHVEAWISANLQRFKSSNANAELLQREIANAAVELQANVDLCKMSCVYCHLKCTLSRRHDPSQQPHDCNTNHQCPRSCDYVNDHPDKLKICQSRAGHDGPHICVVDFHLCGAPCIHRDKKGCQQDCTQMARHEGDHICSARKHACGKPCALAVVLLNRTVHDEPHEQHVCDNRMCPMTCELCKRLCGNTDHLHALDDSSVHLCGEAHRCQALCTAGICEIDTTPQSIEATFTGRHETFQYTKYTQAAKRLPCVKPILAGEREHQDPHTHSLDPAPFHFCESRCENCGYFCTLPQEHPQQEHETSHGSMSRTRWAIDGPDGTAMELNGRRFGANDEGAPMMCNLVCQSMGRHAHLDYCRTDPGQQCAGADHEHIQARLEPNRNRSKDWISHKLYWRRSGFRAQTSLQDPYSRDDQSTFAKCDHMCPGPEHAVNDSQPAQPSYCTLPLFHPPHATIRLSLGYVSNDGHVFLCKNPVVMQQAFHVIFVIDRSGSMCQNTPTPLPATPVTPTILRRHNDRLGAVYLSLHGFWQSRQTALTAAGSGAQGQAAAARRDAYSVILFNNSVARSFENDFQRTPENMLQSLLQYEAVGGTNYEAAVIETEVVMRKHWNGERSPVVVFLSDGECGISDATIRTLCRTAISLGKPLSFHAVSFGPSNQSLRRMAQIAREVENTAPRNASLPANAHVKSSYNEALDSVRLAETFLGIADSLKKTRGALMA
ncbi:hypothetical protein D9756_002245 [Leucocoprinus leucothites]|uniref:VWFA domain-containing protein n=1 Tax=Leucocoprinus leucothites TaxID=201217 RepID=A0A8H5LM39_9AGAR|nr:hypothetical protein D9756_002245 [Leucoagaricus leucothites]